MRLEHRHHLQPLRRRLEVLAYPLDVLAADQRLDDLGARRRSAEPPLFHCLSKLLLVDELPGRFHRGEQSRLGVARRRLRFLRLALGLDALDCLALLQLGQLALTLRVLVLLLRVVGLETVDAAPAGLERHLAPRAEALLLNLCDDRRARVARRRMEDGEEAPRDEVEDP